MAFIQHACHVYKYQVLVCARFDAPNRTQNFAESSHHKQATDITGSTKQLTKSSPPLLLDFLLMNRTCCSCSCCTCWALPANPAVAGEADTSVAAAAEAPPLPAMVERDDTAVTAGEQAPTPADRRDRPATRRERRLTLMAGPFEEKGKTNTTTMRGTGSERKDVAF